MSWHHSLAFWWLVVVPALAVVAFGGAWGYARWCERCDRRRVEDLARALQAVEVDQEERTIAEFARQLEEWQP